MSIDDNPYHAYRHLQDSQYLSREDHAAVQTLFYWGRRRDKDAKASVSGIKRLKQYEVKKDTHIAALEDKLKQLEAAMTTLQESKS